MKVFFETPRLIVRRPQQGDEEMFLSIYGDPQNTRLYADGQPWTRDTATRFLANYPYDDPRLLIEAGLALLKPDLVCVGYGGVGYFAGPCHTPDLFFILAPAFHGHGLATELAQGAIAAAWEVPGIDVIYATVHPDNAPSRRILEKCGLQFVRALPKKDRLLYRLQRFPSGVNP